MPPQVVRATVARQTSCAGCNEEMKRDEPCVWVDREGVFHEGCLSDEHRKALEEERR